MIISLHDKELDKGYCPGSYTQEDSCGMPQDGSEAYYEMDHSVSNKDVLYQSHLRVVPCVCAFSE